MGPELGVLGCLATAGPQEVLSSRAKSRRMGQVGADDGSVRFDGHGRGPSARERRCGVVLAISRSGRLHRGSPGMAKHTTEPLDAVPAECRAPSQRSSASIRRRLPRARGGRRTTILNTSPGGLGGGSSAQANRRAALGERCLVHDDVRQRLGHRARGGDVGWPTTEAPSVRATPTATCSRATTSTTTAASRDARWTDTTARTNQNSLVSNISSYYPWSGEGSCEYPGRGHRSPPLPLATPRTTDGRDAAGGRGCRPRAVRRQRVGGNGDA